MNILIPHTWLLEHLETTATPQQIQKELSLSGPSVERIYDIEGESVYDIEVTTNRVDCMSIRGIAREAAVILTQAGIPSKLKSPKLQELGKGKSTVAGLTIENDPTLCARVLAIVIKDVKRVQSPDWMQKRLRQIGVNVHDVVIDITNYITHEYGHPCHAFDYDKLLKESGGVIRIVEAKKGQSFAIIDGTKYTTLGGEVVFEGKNGQIIDLPAIKGTANTSIDANTKNVCFWIESLDHQKVRFASMAHAIRTVAAQLEEKDLSPELADDTFARGVELYQELAGGVVAEHSLIDVYPGKPSSVSIQMHLSKFTQYLGLEIPHEKITSILHVLGCETELHGQMLTVTPPLWRTDLHIPEDIVEEIARIYGYHNIPSSLMTGEIPTNRPSDTNFALEHQTKELFAALGAQEVYTYSMVNEATASLESSFVLSALENPKSDLDKTHLHLKNPLTDDMVYLRRTLWASHLPILQTPQGETRVLFELANAYIPSTTSETTLPTEELHLTLTSVVDMRLIKGYADALLRSLYLEPIHYKVWNASEATMWSGKTQVGHTLIVKTSKKPMFVVDLNWKALLGIAKKYPTVQPIPKLAPIIEDMTFVMPSGVTTQDVRDLMKKQSPLIQSIGIKDIYQRNVTFTLTYQPDHEMSAEDIAPIRRAIVEHMEAKGLKLVGKMGEVKNPVQTVPEKKEIKPSSIPTQKTEQLYLLDSYKTEMDTVITSVMEEGKRKWKVTLGSTVFYPMGGGQPTDQGSLNSPDWEGSVYQVLYKDGQIYHYVEAKIAPVIGQQVHGTINWDRRLHNMRIHSGGHVVDYAMYLLGFSPKQLVPTKGEHGKDAYILYTGMLFGESLQEKLQEKVNVLIVENRSLETRLVSLSELEKSAIYLQPGLPQNKQLRMLTLEGVGSVADGGTQVHTTGEIGHVIITKIDMENGKTIVHYKVE